MYPCRFDKTQEISLGMKSSQMSHLCQISANVALMVKNMVDHLVNTQDAKNKNTETTQQGCNHHSSSIKKCSEQWEYKLMWMWWHRKAEGRWSSRNEMRSWELVHPQASNPATLVFSTKMEKESKVSMLNVTEQVRIFIFCMNISHKHVWKFQSWRV